MLTSLHNLQICPFKSLSSTGPAMDDANTKQEGICYLRAINQYVKFIEIKLLFAYAPLWLCVLSGNEA